MDRSIQHPREPVSDKDTHLIQLWLDRIRMLRCNMLDDKLRSLEQFVAILATIFRGFFLFDDGCRKLFGFPESQLDLRALFFIEGGGLASDVFV
jgi:hypothetical protein